MQSDEKNNESGETSLTSIYISKTPTKLKYVYNEQLDLEGIIVKAKYSDGTEKTVDGWSASPAPWTNLNTPGTVTVTITYQEKTAFFQVTVANPTEVSATQYFWGVWVKMDDGTEYEVLDATVVKEKKSYKITASDESTLTVSTLGTFTKETEKVMINNNIPYFRKGGVNLEYSLQLVKFTTSATRASVNTSLGGIKAIANSMNYNVKQESESDKNGLLSFTAATAGDIQMVTIANGDDSVVVPGLTINNDGDFMGTVALVGKDDYNLKITGEISEEQKDNGCLYGNGAKTYNMKVSITNISKNKCTSSICTIKGKDSNLGVVSTDPQKENLVYTISTLTEGASKDINLSIEYGDLSTPYIDTGLTVTISNPLTGQEWTDFIPLRFFREAIPITISAKNPESNKNAILNGFVIYPDGNNQYFSVKNDSSKTVYIPTFGTDKEYLLVFSGAMTSTNLSKSTEMYYTVSPCSSTPISVVVQADKDTLAEYIRFGGDNHSEDNAYPVTEGFEAYLTESAIDYYSIPADNF